MLLDEIYKIAATAYPDLWRRCYPRAYRDIGNYGSVKAVAAALATGVLGLQGGNQSDTLRAVGVAALKLFQQNVPTLFLAPEFAAAASQTTPPPATRWDDLRLPFEAALLMFPSGFLATAAAPVSFLGYARIRAGEPLTIPGGGATTLNHNSFITFTAYTQAADLPLLSRALNAADAPFIETADIAANDYHVDAFDLALEGDEAAFLHQATELVFRVLMALQARPEHYRRGRKKEVNRKSGLELWTPNLIGAEYRAARQASESNAAHTEHASPRLHWRRGHFRQQAYGVDFSQRRAVWIEPMLIGGHSNERRLD